MKDQQLTTKEQHIDRHNELHKALDELVADFLLNNKDKYPSNTTVLELIEWSYNQTTDPDDDPPKMYWVPK